MSDIGEYLVALGIPAEYKFPLGCDQKISIDFLNGQFLVFDDCGANLLRKTHRIVPESLSGVPVDSEVVSAAPFQLLPEQVAVLVQYDLACVRRFRAGHNCENDVKIFEPSCSSHSQEFFEDCYDKAKQIAIGRKAKELKRKASGNGVNAKALKIRKEDLNGVSITDDEINLVLSELSAKKESIDVRINLPLRASTGENYELIVELDLPFPTDRSFRINRLVFHDLWRRGFYITTGVKFGCQYLAYESEPGTVHSKYLVKCLDIDEMLNPMHMITLSRVATQVKKSVLLAFVAPDNHIPHYVMVQWWKSH